MYDAHVYHIYLITEALCLVTYVYTTVLMTIVDNLMGYTVISYSYSYLGWFLQHALFLKPCLLSMLTIATI